LQQKLEIKRQYIFLSFNSKPERGDIVCHSDKGFDINFMIFEKVILISFVVGQQKKDRRAAEGKKKLNLLQLVPLKIIILMNVCLANAKMGKVELFLLARKVD